MPMVRVQCSLVAFLKKSSYSHRLPLVTALVSEPNPADATHKISSTSIHSLATKSNQYINPNSFDSVHAFIFSATFGLNDLE